MRNSPNWAGLPAVHTQALEVIADKIARILTGDPNYADNFHDIGGYAKLVENYIESGGKTCLPVQQTLPLGEYEDYPSGVMIDAWTLEAYKALFGPDAVPRVGHSTSYYHAERAIMIQLREDGKVFRYDIP